jgi:hypothetical protein
MRSNNPNFNQYSEKIKGFPDDELFLIRDAAEFTLYSRGKSLNHNLKKNLTNKRFNEYLKKFKDFPDVEIIALRDAAEYEITYIRGISTLDSSKNPNIIKNKYDAVFIGPGDFKLECKKEDIDKKTLDIWNKSSLYTNIPDTYADFLKFVVIKYSNGKEENLTDYVSKLL